VRWDKASMSAPRPPDATISEPLPTFHTDFTDDATVPLDASDPYAGPTPETVIPTSPAAPNPTYEPAFLDPAMDLADSDPWPAAEDVPSADLGDLSAQAAQYELPMRVPQPRPAEPVPNSDNGAAPEMGIMLLVADLDRSLAFYRDTLELEVVDSAADGAVLAYGGGRLLLCPKADMSPVDVGLIYLNIQVPDINAACAGVRAKGVQFSHQPRVFTRGDKLELWAARFRDPDGHGIAVTQWRDRQDAPRG